MLSYNTLREDGMNNNVLQLNRENVLGGIYTLHTSNVNCAGFHILYRLTDC